MLFVYSNGYMRNKWWYSYTDVINAPDPGVLDLMAKNDEDDVIPEAKYHRNPNKGFRKPRKKRCREASLYHSDNRKDKELIKRQYRRERGWGTLYYGINSNGDHHKKVVADKFAETDIRQFLKDSETPEVAVDNSEYIQKLHHVKAEIWRYKTDFGMINVSLGTIAEQGLLDGVTNV